MRNPQDGKYTTEQIIRQTTITPLAFPNIQVLLSFPASSETGISEESTKELS